MNFWQEVLHIGDEGEGMWVFGAALGIIIGTTLKVWLWLRKKIIKKA